MISFIWIASELNPWVKKSSMKYFFDDESNYCYCICGSFCKERVVCKHSFAVTNKGLKCFNDITHLYRCHPPTILDDDLFLLYWLMMLPSSSWWSDNINTSEGTNLYSLTSSNGFFPLINEPTLVQSNSSSVLIYFLLINQICQWILEFMHLYTLTVITKLYTLALILIFLTSYHTSVLYEITKRQILKKLEKHLIW